MMSDPLNSAYFYEGPLDWYRRKGFTKDQITKIQNDLMARGYNLGRFGADGRMGIDTLNAIKQFQRDNGLKVDGLWGTNSQNVLAALQQREADKKMVADWKTERESRPITSTVAPVQSLLPIATQRSIPAVLPVSQQLAQDSKLMEKYLRAKNGGLISYKDYLNI